MTATTNVNQDQRVICDGATAATDFAQTDAGLLPSDWEVKHLREWCERIMVGIASAATHAYRETGVPLLRNQNIKPGYLFEKEILYVDPTYELRFANKRLYAGDLLIARTGYPGTACVVPTAYSSAQSFTTLITRPKRKEIDSWYLCHYINSERGQAFFESHKIGGAQKNVNAGILKEMPVPAPSLCEQKRIAKTLSDVDTLIVILHRLIAKKRAIKTAAMQQLLTGKTRLPGFSEVWKNKRIGEFADCRVGGTPNTSTARYWGGLNRWMSSGELDRKIVTEVEGRITDQGLCHSNAKMLPVDCVLIGLAGQGKTRGTVAINKVSVSTNQSIAAVYPNSAFCAEYLYYNLDLRYAEIRGMSSGEGGRGGLNLKIVRSISVPYPECLEQHAIASVLSDMDKEIGMLERRRDKTKSIRRGMMQVLLTGRIRLMKPKVAA